MPASAASMAEPAKSCASLSADRSNERALLAFGGSERMTRRSATVPQASMELPTTPIASAGYGLAAPQRGDGRSEEHTSELQSLMRISYAVFCLKQKNNTLQTEMDQRKTE